MSRLSLENVTFSYNGNLSIKNLSLSINRGELVGLMGPNGSGKSTLIRLALGILKPSSGRVLLDQKPVSAWSGQERSARISHLPQTLDLPLPFKVIELVRIGRETTRGEKRLSVADAIGLTGLSGYEERQLQSLSGGERKRAFIAMTLAQGAEILLLDEPLASLDLRYQHELLELMNRLCREQQLTILLSLHELTLARKVDRLLMLQHGTLLADAPPDRLLNRGQICQLFGLGGEIDPF